MIKLKSKDECDTDYWAKRFERETIECPLNTPGLFRYAESIVKSEIDKGKGQAFVLEMLKFSLGIYERAVNSSKEDSE